MELPSIWKMSVHSNRQPLGSVKIIHTEIADYYEKDEHWVEGPRKPMEDFSSDHQGRLVECIKYDFYGSVQRKYIYKYDSGGRLIGSNSLKADDSLLYRTVYTYDLESTCTLIVYGADGSIEEKVIYTCDSEQKPLQRMNYYPDGSLSHRWIREINTGGVVTRKCVDYNPDGAVTGRWSEVDDPNRKEYQHCSYDADGLLNSKQVSSYDSERKEIERNYYGKDGSLERRLVWEYDSAGNTIKKTAYSAQCEIEEQYICVYEFDQIGNWITRTYLFLVLGSDPPQHRPGSVVYRTITYWPEQQS